MMAPKSLRFRGDERTQREYYEDEDEDENEATKNGVFFSHV